MAGKKVQVPVLGGLRKVIQVPTSQNVGTTIQEFGSQVVSLAQLKAALGITNTKTTTTTGGGSLGSTSLIVGPGMSGGGVLTGAVNIGLLQPISPVVWQDALLPDDWVGSGGSGGGSGGGGSSTLAGLSDVAISGPTSGQVLTYNGTKWQNQAAGGGSAGTTSFGPTLVQSKYFRWKPTGAHDTTSITLSSTPTVGNVLVAMITGYDTSTQGTIAVPTGFTQIAYLNTGNAESIAVGVRVVQSGDGTSWTFSGGNGGDTIGMWEFSNVDNVQVIQALANTSGSVFTVGNVQTGSTSFTIGIAQSDGINAYQSISGASLLFDGTDSAGGTNNHPAVLFQPTKMGNVAITYTGTSFILQIAASIIINGPVQSSTSTVILGNVNPDLHPSTPDTTNDEFEGTTLDPKWTLVNSTGGTATSTVTLSQGSAVIQSGWGSVDHPFLLTQAVTGTWTYTAKCAVAQGNSGSTDVRVGMYVGLGGTNKFLAFGIFQNSQELYVNAYTNPNTFSATQTIAGTAGAIGIVGGWLYLQISYDGTNIIFRASNSGVPGSFIQFATETAASFLGSAPTSIGLFSDGNRSSGSPGVVDWFRRTDTVTVPQSLTPYATNITPDVHPTNPTPYDDEFELGTAIDTTGARLSGAIPWTGYTSTTVASTVAQGALQNVTQTGSPSAGSGFAMPVPSGTWTFVWKGLRPALQIFNLSTWKGYYFGTSGSGNNMLVQHETRNWATGSYSFGGSDSSFSTNGNPAYFMLRFDGTNLIFSWAQSGYTVDFTQLISVAASSWIVTPDHIGFGTSPQVAVDWFRRTA